VVALDRSGPLEGSGLLVNDVQDAQSAPRDPARPQSPRPRTTTLATFAVIAGIALFLYLVRDILLPFVLGGIVAYICTPLIDWLNRRTGLPRFAIAMIVLVVLMTVAALFGFLVGPSLVSQIMNIVGDLHGTVTRFAQALIGDGSFTLLGQSFDATQIADEVVNGLHRRLAQNGTLLTVAELAIAIVFGFVLSWVVLGYLLNDAPAVGKGMIWLVPPDHRAFAGRVWRELDPVLRRYFIGVALVVLYATTAAYVGLGLILGIHDALFLALLTGVLELIPLVGPVASAVIAGLVAVQQSTNVGGIVEYVFYAAALRISIDEFFGPIVLGRAAYVRPVLVIFCFLTGGLLFGIVGVVLAVPVALALKATLATLYREQEAHSD